MRRLLLIYIGAIIMIFTLPVMLTAIGGLFGNHKTSPNEQQSIIPKQIRVFFADEGVTKEVDFEEYLKGVLPAEVPALFNNEALKAQAVAARTYAYHKYLKFTNDPSIAPAEHKDAIVCTNPTHCNAYYTKEQLLKKHGKSWMDLYWNKFSSAVDDTRSEVMVYDDQPILAVFHSASAGGFTEACKDVWGSDLPYLVSVKSSGEDKKDGYISTVVIPQTDFVKTIEGQFSDAKFPKDKNKWIGKIVRTQGSSVGTIEIGGVQIKGVVMREMFKLKSAHFEIKLDSDNVVFTVEGFGHGVGMSQYGANEMANNGDKYPEILKAYYKDAQLKKY